MKIEDLRCKIVKLKDLHPGELFEDIEDRKIYIRTDMDNIISEGKYECHVVDTESGTNKFFNENKEVREVSSKEIMNIVRKTVRARKISELDFGDVFEIDGECYMKVSGEAFNAVNLGVGIVVDVTNDATILPVPNATLTL